MLWNIVRATAVYTRKIAQQWEDAKIQQVKSEQTADRLAGTTRRASLHDEHAKSRAFAAEDS
jgi:hypothetical protein